MHDHQEVFIDWLIEIVPENAVELVVIAGDIFDRSVPPQESIVLFERALTQLSRSCPVFVIPGNHDSAVRLGYGGVFFAANGVHIQSKLSEIGNPLEIAGTDDTQLVVYGIPFLHPDIHHTELGVERSHTAVLNAAMEQVRTDLAGRSGVRSIAVSHAFVTGGAGSDSERDLEIGGIGDAPGNVFAGVDYVAMGHLHGEQNIKSDSGVIRYSGSPLPYSFSEEKHLKSVTLIDIPQSGPISYTSIPTPQPAPLVTLRGSIEDLLNDPDHADHADSWVRLRITDPRRPENSLKQLSKRFTNVMQLEFDPEPIDGEVAESGARLDPQKTPPIELASAFVEHVTSDRISEAEIEVLQSAIEQVSSRVESQ
jgi:DNA repair protein SbcD/Mre11